MARGTTSVELLYTGNDTVVEARGVMNEVTGEYLNSATVTCTLLTSAGVEVTGQSWPLAMAYVSSSDGVYRATVPKTVAITANGRYKMQIDVNAGAGLVGQWTVPCLCRVRT